MNTLTVPSGFRPRKTPKPDGGAVSFSTSSRRSVDLLAGLLEHPDQALVLLERLDEASLDLTEALLEEPDRAGLAAAERLF